MPIQTSLKTLLLFTAIVLTFLAGCASADKAQRSPTLTEILTQGQDVSFEVCGESSTWVRPSETEQTEKWWKSGRYAGTDEKLLKLRWTDDFFIVYGSASSEYDLQNLSGLWTLPADTRDACLEPQRQDAILKLQTGEVWILSHKVTSIKRLKTNYVVVVKPTGSGVQFVQFSRPDQKTPLTLRFITKDSQEIESVTEAESPDWPYPSLIPTRQP